MTTDDIERITAEYERVHAATQSVTTSRQDADGWIAELDQQQAAINQALDGIEDLETFYDGLVKKYQHLRDEVSDKKKKLVRDFDDCKRTAIRLQQAKKRSNSPS